MLFMRAMAAIKIEKSLTLSLLMTSSKKLVRPFTFPWYGSNNFWKIRKPLFLGRVSSRQRLLSLQRRKATEKCAPITLISPQCNVSGEFGPFQKMLYLMFSLPYVETAMQLLGWVFVGATPIHNCPLERNSTFQNRSDYDAFHFEKTHVTSSATIDWSLVCHRSGYNYS